MHAATLAKLYALDRPFLTVGLPEDFVEQPWEAPLEEVVVRATLGTGADVRFVAGGTDSSPTDGVGALLRYAD